MRVVNHRLEGIPFRQATTSRLPQKPSLLVIHYTATQFSPANAFAMQKAASSAHIIVDKGGEMLQMVEFNITAAHAGKSAWKGREGCNRFSVGIEIVNPGPLQMINGQLCDTTARKPWTGGVVNARHQNPNVRFDRWAAYSEAQLAATIAASKAICEEYGITDIVGHEDVSPGRKIDPGPAFPWDRFRAEVLG